jgi:hypothetical protein
MADCERVHDGWLDEPVNALSSLAYVALGAWSYRQDRVQGAALVALGAGSFAFHAVDAPGARLLHDASIGVVAVLVVVALPRIVRNARARPKVAWVAGCAFAIAVPLQLFGRTGGPLCRQDSVWQAHAGWHLLTAFAIAAAFALARPRTLSVGPQQ